MKRITEKDLDNLKFDGIIVSVSKNIKDGQHDDIGFVLECNYFTNGKHGYKEPGEGDCTSSFYNICYNMDCLPNGLWMNATSRFTIEHSFKFDSYDYYKFESMTDFCVWYLRRQTTDKEDKNWIQEKCGTNTPPTSVPEKPSVGNKKHNITRREQLKDVIEYLHQYEHVCDLRDKVRNGSIPRIEYTQTIADLEDWLDEEI